MRILALTLVCILLFGACKTHAFLPGQNKFVEIRSDYLGFGVRYFELVGPDSVGVLNRRQFEKRFNSERGHVRVLNFMDSTGYELYAPLAANVTGLFAGTNSTTYKLIFKKKEPK